MVLGPRLDGELCFVNKSNEIILDIFGARFLDLGFFGKGGGSRTLERKYPAMILSNQQYKALAPKTGGRKGGFGGLAPRCAARAKGSSNPGARAGARGPGRAGGRAAGQSPITCKKNDVSVRFIVDWLLTLAAALPYHTDRRRGWRGALSKGIDQ